MYQTQAAEDGRHVLVTSHLCGTMPEERPCKGKVDFGPHVQRFQSVFVVHGYGPVVLPQGRPEAEKATGR